jgi:hypothetical protein
MADKKISALSQIADADIESDVLLHIVDNPSATPINKRMTVGQMFENIPTHLAVDDFTTLTVTSAALNTTFGTVLDVANFASSLTFTLADGTDNGQLKVIYASSDHASYTATVNVTNALTSHNSIVFNDGGQAVLLVWNSTVGKWFVLANYGATIS